MNEKRGRGRPKKRSDRKARTLTVSEEAWEALDQKAKALGLTRSDLVERLGLEADLSDLSAVAEIRLLGESSAS